eukprot:CAMPEP_0184864080 /NCGR_PEP_ID=MMETSP0580-20130426/13657_1 /TAXON_ID=1118495 /ORGANISM="Dactyliosolen fragilissimus" /LENGTH=432 /DNA_ID=CAMNT_0027362721 /DNA_START=19 /DNA_END=1318 /DNA_ORIENTATION=+
MRSKDFKPNLTEVSRILSKHEMDVMLDNMKTELPSVKSQKKVEKSIIVTNFSPFTSCFSLGCGIAPAHGPISWVPSPPSSVASLQLDSTSDSSSNEDNDTCCCPTNSSEESQILLEQNDGNDILRRKVLYDRSSSSFLRTSDLDIESDESSRDDLFVESDVHHFHIPSNKPPPGMNYDKNENWVALDNGDGHHTPIAPRTIRAFVGKGLMYISDSSMWVADKKTKAALEKNHHWDVWNVKNDAKLGDIPDEENVFSWIGKFDANLYGGEIPCVRAQGLIKTSPESLFALLLDSSRVKEYNKASLGRTDLVVFSNDLKTEGPFGESISKIVRNRSKIPIVSKIVQLTSLLHGEKLERNAGFVIVSRAVTIESKSEDDSSTLYGEVLTGVTLIHRVYGDPNRSLMTTLNHIKAPIPLWIAKKKEHLQLLDFSMT